MANPLELTYRTYAVHYADNMDVWRCSALDLEAERLPTLKAKIDKVIAASRKLVEPVPVVYVDYHGAAKPARIMALVQPGKDRQGSDKEPSSAWCMTPGTERFFDHSKGGFGYREVDTRKKLPLDRLFQDTPENAARIAEAGQLEAEIKRLTAKRAAVLKAMTHVSAALFGIASTADGVEEETTNA